MSLDIIFGNFSLLIGLSIDRKLQVNRYLFFQEYFEYNKIYGSSFLD